MVDRGLWHVESGGQLLIQGPRPGLGVRLTINIVVLKQPYIYKVSMRVLLVLWQDSEQTLFYRVMLYTERKNKNQRTRPTLLAFAADMALYIPQSTIMTCMRHISVRLMML